jgi:quinol monooxygenase YgiN
MSQKVTSVQSADGLIVRIAEIEVYPEYLNEYLAYASEVDRLSVEREPGVICLFPMQDPADSCQIRILEIYANDAVYQAHLKTDHFQKYKQGTLKMVKSLKLNTMQPMDKEMMKAMFGKMR